MARLGDGSPTVSHLDQRSRLSGYQMLDARAFALTDQLQIHFSRNRKRDSAAGPGPADHNNAVLGIGYHLRGYHSQLVERLSHGSENPKPP